MPAWRQTKPSRSRSFIKGEQTAMLDTVPMIIPWRCRKGTLEYIDDITNTLVALCMNGDLMPLIMIFTDLIFKHFLGQHGIAAYVRGYAQFILHKPAVYIRLIQ